MSQELCCCCRKDVPCSNVSANPKTKTWFLGVLLGVALWALIFSHLEPLAKAVMPLFSLEPGSHAYESLLFFIYDTPKVLMLLSLIVFFMTTLRSFFSPEGTRALLAGKREGVGHVVAACFGIITPFCTCSAVSIFVGFISSGVPLGIAFSFLIAAPMVNEIALGLLWGLVGWKVALLYLGFGLTIAIVSGAILGRLNLEKWLEGWVQAVREGEAAVSGGPLTWPARFKMGLNGVRDILGKVWIWMVLGIGVGALIHGYAPADTLSEYLGRETWWSVPLAVVVGVPLYANAAGVLPIVEALLGKGVALGTVLALMMSVTALSLPEAIILRRVLSIRLIGLFFAIVTVGILAVGYLFNAVL